MKFLHPHRFWLAVLGCALILMWGADPLLGVIDNHAQHYLTQAQSMRMEAEKTLQQLNADIVLTQELSGRMNTADIEKTLAPVDRLQMADLLERQAAAAQLHRFTYTLSPEQKQGDGADAQPLALSTIALAAEVPLDTNAYTFVEALRQVFPGRLQLQRLSLERIGEGTLTSSNLHLKANLEWLSNGVTKDVAGQMAGQGAYNP